jgi:peptide/nickel transport system permease protein
MKRYGKNSSVKAVQARVPEEMPARKIGWLERWLGPDNYLLLRNLARTPASIIGFILIGFFILVAIFAPLIAPPLPGKDPYIIPRDGFNMQPRPMMSAWSKNQPPLPAWWGAILKTDQWVHILGTTSGQYDIFYGIVWGTRVAFFAGLVITLSVFIIGLIIGSISAFYGGVVDTLLMRIVDIFMTLPFLMAALILASVLIPKLGRTILPAVIALIAFSWMPYARLIRGDILTVKEREYVTAARVIGVRKITIVFKHILPNAIFPTLVYATMDIGSYVLSFAALSFLGVGTDAGYSDWGQLLSFSRNWITALDNYWYIVVWPGLALILYCLSWNLVGDALRDALDPRMRGTK